jgi:hypothetical protein
MLVLSVQAFLSDAHLCTLLLDFAMWNHKVTCSC